MSRLPGGRERVIQRARGFDLRLAARWLGWGGFRLNRKERDELLSVWLWPRLNVAHLNLGYRRLRRQGKYHTL